MKTIGYLINQYPAASQTFIRREIQALEDEVGPIQRYAVRGPAVALVDPDDQAELAHTRRILDGGLRGLAAGLLHAALTRPGRLLRALATAWRLGRLASKRLLHLVYLAEACVLARWTARDRIDHLHVHFGTNSATVALLCRALGGPPFSVTVHGPEEFDRPVALGLREKAAAAAFMIAVCRYGRSQLWRWADFADWPKVHVVHCGVDPTYLAVDPGPPSESTKLVNIGRLVEQKGQLMLVEAAARLREMGLDFEIVVIGDGPFRPALEERIRDLGLNQQVRLLGWRTGEQVREALIGSRGLVLPSFAEGLPVAIMEALALRRPVVSTYVAGIPELVRPGENGWLVPAGDVDALADAMAELLRADPTERARLGAAGASRVATEHDVRREARKLLSLIETTPEPSGATPSA